jgi:5-methylcytosine-specific restriction endonuclease McrA
MARTVYQKYLRSRRWREKRSAVILRSRGICERCGAWPVAGVHHLTYAGLGNEHLDQLLGVCSRCHKELHGV